MWVPIISLQNQNCDDMFKALIPDLLNYLSEPENDEKVCELVNYF